MRPTKVCALGCVLQHLDASTENHDYLTENMKPILPLLVLTAAVLAIPCALDAQVITQWNFNDSTTSPSTGTGMLTLLGGVTSTFGTGSPDDSATPNEALQTTTYPAASTGSGTAGVEFAVSTVGMNGTIQISLDLRQSGTASRYLQLQVSTNGTTFAAPSTGTGAVNGPINSPNSMTSFSNTGLYSNNSGTGSQTFVENILYTIPANSVYANDANFAFEFVSVFDPTNGTSYTASSSSSTYATTGNIRFDEVTVAVPEPSTWTMLAAGAAGLLAFVMRRARGTVQVV